MDFFGLLIGADGLGFALLGGVVVSVRLLGVGSSLNSTVIQLVQDNDQDEVFVMVLNVWLVIEEVTSSDQHLERFLVEPV